MARKKAPSKGLSATVRKRLQKLPGKQRSYLDPKTGSIFSRRQYEKGRVKIPRKNAPAITRKYRQYQQILDSYIAKQQLDGKKLNKKEARESLEMKKIIKDLHSKNKQKQFRALQKTMRGAKIVEKDGLLQSLQYVLN